MTTPTRRSPFQASTPRSTDSRSLQLLFPNKGAAIGLALAVCTLLTPDILTADSREATPSESPAATTSPAEAAEKNPGLERLHFMIGTWDVEARDQDGKLQFNTVSTIRLFLDGKALEETVTGYWGDQEWPMRLLRSYDVVQDSYRMVALDGVYGFLDVYEGKWVDGRLEDSNLEANTFTTFEGTSYHYRSRLERQGSGFVLTTDASGDDGATWQNAGSFRYTPATE